MGETHSELFAAGRGLVVLSGTAVTDGSGDVSAANTGKGSGIASVAHSSGVYTVTLASHVSSFLFCDAQVLNTSAQKYVMQIDAVTTGAADTAAVAFNTLDEDLALDTGGVISSTLMFIFLVAKSSVPGGGLT